MLLPSARLTVCTKLGAELLKCKDVLTFTHYATFCYYYIQSQHLLHRDKTVSKLIILSKPSLLYQKLQTYTDAQHLFHTEDRLELLEKHHLKARGGGETRPDGDEAGIQAPGSVLGHNLRNGRQFSSNYEQHKLQINVI